MFADMSPERQVHYSRKSLYEEAGISSLAKSRDEHASKIVYLGLNQQSTSFINEMFSELSDFHSETTRSSLMEEVYVPRCKLECCKGNIKIRGPMCYNKLPEHVPHAKNS